MLYHVLSKLSVSFIFSQTPQAPAKKTSRRKCSWEAAPSTAPPPHPTTTPARTPRTTTSATT